jgi:hypothetical protein
MKKHAAPIIAAVLLLLPVFYVGSYLALVKPMSIAIRGGVLKSVNYRAGDELTSRFFWPLEQIDRKVRPGTWKSPQVSVEDLVRAMQRGGSPSRSSVSTDPTRIDHSRFSRPKP